MRLAVQLLLGSAAAADRLSPAPQRVAEKLPIRVGELGSEAAAFHKLQSSFHSIREVRRPDIELAHAGMQSFKRICVVGR